MVTNKKGSPLGLPFLLLNLSFFSLDITIYVLIFIPTNFTAGVAQLVERHLAKVNVAGSNPVSRSFFMKVDAKIIKKENASALLEIEVDEESIRTESEKILKKYQDKASVPGFRKGKTPISIIKSKFQASINEDILSSLIPRAYSEAVDITKISPYTMPEIQVEAFDENHLKFKADVQLRPEVEISSYKDLTFHRDEYKISKKDLEKELEKLRDRFADYSSKDDSKIVDNDQVIIQVEAFDEDNQIVKELSNDNHKIEVNKNNLYEEFYDNLIGLKQGDEKKFSKTYPMDFNNKMLAGKKVLFKIKIKEVQEKKLPELDDKFAKDVGDYKNLDELKKVIEEQMKGILEHHLEHRLEKSILEKIVGHSKFEIPKKLIDDRSTSLLNQFQQNLSQQGHDFKKMIEQKVINLDKIKQEVNEQAVKDLKEYLLIMKIIELENIKVEENEIDDFIKKEAENYKQKFEDYKKKLNQEALSYIKNEIITKKVLNFIKEHNKIKKGKTCKMEDILKEAEQRR